MPLFKLDPRETIFSTQDLLIESLFPRPAHVRILVVLEPNINHGPPGAPGTDFGLARVVEYLRNDSFGFVRFTVHYALRGNDPNSTQPIYDSNHGDWDFRYTNFRYHSVLDGKQVIDGYDEIWCFGFMPAVHDNGSNSSVTGSPYSSSNTEVTAISDWMDAGGGVLAMGDHNFLGAAMCWNLPRVGTMRAWLKDTDDGKSVPNRTGSDRHDTNRPQNASQTYDPASNPNPSTIPNSAEEDTVTQPLDWKRYTTWSPWLMKKRERPHPVLCGGSLGVIDRFPDHPHEGLVIHESLINLNADCQHDSGKKEYPTVSGVKPTPEVIAWVDSLGTPPYSHAKGDQPARHFPAIGVYDGHAITHGRVLVDSTWHHWLDMNIADLEAANTTDFKKIRRYFENVAIWLAPKKHQQRMLSYGTLWTVLSPWAVEDLTVDTNILLLGGQAIDILGRATSDCLVESWLWTLFPIELHEIRRPFKRPPDPCWTCPPDELFLRAIMGGVVQELLPLRDELVEKTWGKRDPQVKLDDGVADRAVEVGVRRGLDVALKALEANRRPLSSSINRMRKGMAALDEECGD